MNKEIAGRVAPGSGWTRLRDVPNARGPTIELYDITGVEPDDVRAWLAALGEPEVGCAAATVALAGDYAPKVVAALAPRLDVAWTIAQVRVVGDARGWAGVVIVEDGDRQYVGLVPVSADLAPCGECRAGGGDGVLH